MDTTKVIADVSYHPLGIGLHFIGDSPAAKLPLQQLQVGTLRFASSDYYLFDAKEPNNPKVAIQDESLWQVESFAKPDGTWWGKLDFDNFMAICQDIGAEPFVVIGIDAIAYTGNAPHASPEEVLQSAVEWVKYANQEKQYHVKYWEIGNESNLKNGNPINWTPELYAQTVNKFARAMKAVDPSIKIGANGMKIDPKQDWWNQIMPRIKDEVDFLVTHQYSWLSNYQEWLGSNHQYDYNLQDAIQAIKTYKPQLPLNVTENSSFNSSATHSNNTWKMLHNFEMLGQTLSLKEVEFIHFWTSRWTEEEPLAGDYSAFDHNYKLLPMGYPVKIWNNFLQGTMIQTSKAIGTVSSWASYEPSNNSLSIFLLNKDLTPQDIRIDLNNYQNPQDNECWVLQGASPQSNKVTWSKIGSVKYKKSQINTRLEPLSVTVISFPENKP